VSEVVNRFYNSIEGGSQLTQNERIDFFVYFLTVELGESAASTKRIRECFEECDLPVPGRLPQYLSDGLRAKPPKFVRTPSGYRLQRHTKDAVATRLGAETITVQASAELRQLEASFPDGSAKSFLKETIDCFEAGANQAAIVMCWILAVDHLYSYIIKYKMTEFNALLAKNTDKRIKITAIVIRDDFSEIPEGKFIEFCRSAGIISNDVRKILEEKLGTRNSSAHPSGITIKRSKVIEFIEDLVTNVVGKYAI
jgi:hypothetical protein